jgi:hypothetical protein
VINKPPRRSEWLNGRTAARILGKCPRTVKRWVESAYLPGQLVGPRKQVRVRRADVLALLASWTVQPVLDFKKVAAGDVD